MCCNGRRDVARCRRTHARSVAMADGCVAMADRTLQDASARRFATLTGERTTVNGATPKYGRYCMCCNKPTETCGSMSSGGRDWRGLGVLKQTFEHMLVGEGRLALAVILDELRKRHVQRFLRRQGPQPMPKLKAVILSGLTCSNYLISCRPQCTTLYYQLMPMA